MYSIFKFVAVFNFEILQKIKIKLKIYKSISLPQIPSDATICDLIPNFPRGRPPGPPIVSAGLRAAGMGVPPIK